MDTNIKISIISVSMAEEYNSGLFNYLTTTLEGAFKKSLIEVQMYTNIESIENLKEEIILFTEVNMADVILVFGEFSLKNTIIEAINKVSNAKTEIVKLFAKIPMLLWPLTSQYLYYSYRGNTLIFCVTGDDETTIINTVESSAQSMMLAAYLLQNITNCDVSNYSLEKGDQIMSCNNNDQSSPPKREEKKMSISPTLTCDEKIQIDEATALAPTYQEGKALTISFALTRDENIRMNEANIHALTNQTIQLPMVAVEAALSMIYDELMKNNDYLRKEYVDIKNSFGKRICDAVVCYTSVPPFSVATKHGYALSAVKQSNKITSFKFDFNTPKWVNSGDPIPLETIAVIPANNVVTVYTYERNKFKARIHLKQSMKKGENIKFIGSDIRRGEIIVNQNVSIGSMEMGLLAACGWKKINVFREIGIGVLTIGDNLLEPGEPLEPKHSYDSNRVILISLLKENGFNSSDFGITAKVPTIIIQKIKEALETVDLLITTGCSNDKDCLKAILKNYFNATLHFGNVNMKPGKSTVFATCIFNNKTKYILCLPGNPVSVFVSAHIFLLTLLNLMYTNIKLEPTIVMAKIKQKLRLHSRRRYVLATLFWSDGERFAEVICKESNSINNNLSNIINANALLILPMKTPEINKLEAPSFVQAMLIKFPFTYMPTNKIVG